MSRVIIKKYDVASLDYMDKLALLKIFEPEKLSVEQEKLLEDSINRWVKKIDLTLEEKKHLKIIIDALLKNEDGGFNETKESIKRFGITYRDIYYRFGRGLK